METPKEGSPLDAIDAAIHCEQISLEFASKHPSKSRGSAVANSPAHSSGSAHRSQRVLNNLNLTVPSGQIVSLLGASGCGKSTLLRVIAGLQKPDSGRVALHGRQHAFAGRASTADKLAFVFQESALLPWRTVRENVLLPLELQGIHRSAEAIARAERWLRTVGLAETDWQKKPTQLSGGMKMRASIARSMVNSPDILLMDEPFAALDDVLRSKLCDLVLEIVASRKCAVLFVTHNIAEAVYLSDRIDIMAAGQIANSVPVSFPQVSFPKGRHAELRSTPEFLQVYASAAQSLFQNSEGAS